MNTTTIKALIFAAGALVGSAVTYILCSKAAKDRRDELVADYEAEIKELGESIYAKDIPQESQEAGSSTDPMKFKTEERTDYSGYFNPESVNGPKMTANSYENIVRQSSFPGSEDEGPVLVEQEVYEKNPDGYTKFELRYYMDDDYLCDVQDIDTPIMDIEKYVGYDNLSVFRHTDAEYIWIVNHRTCSIYEVEVYRNGPCPINDIFDPD